jgi:cell division protein FtsW
MDAAIYLIVVILALFGIVMVFSSSYIATGRSALYNYNSYYFLNRQAINAGVGFFAMNFMANFNYRFLRKFTIPLYLASIALLVVTFTFGVATRGETRWLPIPLPILGTYQFQPSEFGKVGLILILAMLISGRRNILRGWRGTLFCAAVTGVMALFVGIGNLSTAIIIVIIGLGMVFLASPYLMRFFIAGSVGAGGLVGYLYYMAYYAPADAAGAWRGGRFLSWLNPWENTQGYSYQIVNSLYAVASGGLFGLGIGQSRQKTLLPEAQNDYIFAIICEELGLVGAGFVLLLFGILIWRGVYIARHAPDIYGSMIASGIVIMLMSQVVINIAVVTNTIPPTGIPLPFISYGGTSLLVCMASVGVLLNISKYARG